MRQNIKQTGEWNKKYYESLWSAKGGHKVL